MSSIDSERLLAPISASEPSGPNLEYDPAFADLERAAVGKPERQMGDSIVPGEPPEWKLVAERAAALLERTKDLRVASYLVVAVTQRAGFEGLRAGLSLLAGLLAGFWDTLHPELDPDDGNDPTMRITALAAVCAPPVLASLRAAPLVRSRGLGAISLRDLLTSSSDAARPGEAQAVDGATAEAIFREVELPVLQAVVECLQAAAARLADIEGVFETHAGSRGPDFSPLLTLIQQASVSLKPRLQSRLAAEAADVAPSASAEGEPVMAESIRTHSVRALEGEISSRADVVRALEKICAYYERHEPSSPLPLLLQRCKRLVPLGFLDIMRDLAPDALSQVELIAGKVPE